MHHNARDFARGHGVHRSFTGQRLSFSHTPGSLRRKRLCGRLFLRAGAFL